MHVVLTSPESNSMICQVVERALSKLQKRAAATPGARAIGVVRLFGLVHADERTAFKACSCDHQLTAAAACAAGVS